MTLTTSAMAWQPRFHSAWRWSRENLFSSPANTVLTVVTLAAIVYGAYQAGQFVFQGADWEVVDANRGLFFVFRFPRDEVWRVWLSVHLASGLAGLSWGLWGRIAPRLGAVIGVALVPVYLFMLDGNAIFWATTCIAVFAVCFMAGQAVQHSPLRDPLRTAVAPIWLLAFALSVYLLGEVSTRLWGGVLLTMILAVVGIVVSFPLGVLLAVGRASSFPVIRLFCIVYIEVMRGVPLVTVLFMAFFIVPLMIEPKRDILGVAVTGRELDVVVRAMIGLILFTGAYIAEVVRGGLNAVPRGQVEAAQALGLGGVRILALIVLPQALRAVIPALVSQFISLYKDTSLVFILGLTEILGVARASTAQPAFIGHHAETLAFAALLYWVVCFSMSRASQRLEYNLGVGER